MEILELKNKITTTTTKSLNGLNSRIEITEKKASELEDRAITIIQPEQERKNIEKNYQELLISGTCGTTTKSLTFK